MGGPGAPDDLVAGSATQVWLATAPDVEPRSGGYWYHQRPQSPDPHVLDPDFQGRLISALEAHTGIPLG